MLKVEHVIVCGHYGCGGVATALTPRQFGLIDNWIRAIKDVARKNHDVLFAEKVSVAGLGVQAAARAACALRVLVWMSCPLTGPFPSLRFFLCDRTWSSARTSWSSST